MFKTLVSIVFAAGLLVGVLSVCGYSTMSDMQQAASAVSNSQVTYQQNTPTQQNNAGPSQTAQPTKYVGSGGASYVTVAVNSVYNFYHVALKSVASVMAGILK